MFHFIISKIKQIESILRAKLGKYYQFLLYLILIVFINLAALSLFFQIDLTAGRSYSLSDASKKAVSTLSEPLTIKVFFTKNLPAPHNTIERSLRDLLQEYAIYGNRYFNYVFYNMSQKEGDTSKEAKENLELAKNYGINPVQIRTIDKDQVKYQSAYMGMVIIHGDAVKRIRSVTTTDGLEYLVTTTIQKMNNKISALLNISDKIEARAYLSGSLNEVAPGLSITGAAELPSKLEALFEKINQKSYNKFEYSFADPSRDLQAAKEARAAKVTSIHWPAFKDELGSGKSFKAGEAFTGLTLTYKGKTEVLPLVQSKELDYGGVQYELLDPDSIEDAVSGHIESLLDINQKIGYLVDHGTWPIFDDAPEGSPQKNPYLLDNFQRVLGQAYSVKPVNMADGIPDNIQCLIINGPKAAFSPAELYQIDQFLMRGKSLAVLMDAFIEIPAGQSSYFITNDTGLEKLIAHYGMSLRPGFVIDGSCAQQEDEQNGRITPIHIVPIIKNEQVNSRLYYMKNIKGLYMYKNSPVDLDSNRIADQKLSAQLLFWSSPDSGLMHGDLNTEPAMVHANYAGLTKSLKSSMPLAYMLEGSFKSLFSGSTNIKNTDFIPQGKPGKLFLIGSSEILNNQFVDPEGKSPNSLFIMNIIDYLNHNKDTAIMRSKTQRFNPLNNASSGAKAAVKILNIFVLPVLAIGAGILVYFIRQNRKRKIEKLFRK